MTFYRKLGSISFNILLLIEALNGGVSHAQTVPSAGAVLQQQQQALPYNRNNPTYQEKRQPEAVQEEVKPTPEKQAGPSQSITIRRIIVEKVTLLNKADVQVVVAPYENRKITFEDIVEITRKLTTMYQDKGYVTSRVIIPPQELDSGDLHLQAFEGSIGKINVTSGKYYGKRYVLPRLNVSSGDPFNLAALKKTLKTINSNPDAFVSASLEASEEQGKTDINLLISDRHPYHATPNLDNYGRRLIGYYSGGTLLQHNNLLGFGDKLSGSVDFTNSSQNAFGHYEFPVGKYGTVLAYDQGWSHLRLGKEFEVAEITGGSSSYTPSILQPIITTQNVLLSADLAFDLKQQYTDFFGESFNRDQVSVLRPGINFQQFDKHGSTYIRNEIGWGLNAFGAGNIVQAGVPHAGGNNAFFRYLCNFNRTQALPWGTWGLLRGSFQYSPDNLVSSEQFQFGGVYTVRGYGQGDFIGNSGLSLSAEWHVPFNFLPESWKMPFSKEPVRNALQMVSFFDFGTTFASASAGTGLTPQQAVGTGAGIRARLSKFLSLRLDVGIPIVHYQGLDTKPRIHFGLDAPMF